MRKWIVIAAAFSTCIALIIARASILTAIACGLIVDDSPPDARQIVLVGGDHCYEVAAQMVKEDERREVLVFREGPNRLVECKIVKAWEEIAVEQLKKHGAPENSMQLSNDRVRDEWELAASISRWADAHPEQKSVVLTDRFASRKLRMLLGRCDHRSFVAVRALTDRRYDETNWWQSRTGIKSVLDSYLSLAYHWAAPVPTEHYEDTWDPSGYEKSLVASSR